MGCHQEIEKAKYKGIPNAFMTHHTVEGSP